ncbi:LemA family protein [Segetibacter sp. 3557_3]|uniref:LemA family protein n=1 Tax=Segetibacter sp. 3557_3 TaxID=2547429 RepID=UPI001058B54B|nr:LemA family protein [Segetibacter sp. 3557_3]TDH26048.1 LemA family protein [Segetibacter sp. 3557_3]
MKTKNLTLIIIIAAVLLLGGCGCGQYNSLVTQDETVKNAWNKVQSDYQRRSDLIPNLVATVKGAANFEKETYTQVALARAGQLKQAVNVPVDSLSPQKMQQIQQASTEALNAARMVINVAVERYPDLKATGNFSNLQVQLEGTENRIKTARNDYNDAVQTYNTQVRRFPTNIFAGMMGFKQRAGFAAEAGADRAPDVQF